MVASDALRGAFVEAAFTQDQVDASIARDSEIEIGDCAFLEAEAVGSEANVSATNVQAPSSSRLTS